MAFMFILTNYLVLNKYSTLGKNSGDCSPHASQLKRGFSGCGQETNQAKLPYVAACDFGCKRSKKNTQICTFKKSCSRAVSPRGNNA
jgi:hypothetical protein